MRTWHTWQAFLSVFLDLVLSCAVVSQSSFSTASPRLPPTRWPASSFFLFSGLLEFIHTCALQPETAVADAIMKRTEEHLRKLGGPSVSAKPIVMKVE